MLTVKSNGDKESPWKIPLLMSTWLSSLPPNVNIVLQLVMLLLILAAPTMIKHFSSLHSWRYYCRERHKPRRKSRVDLHKNLCFCICETKLFISSVNIWVQNVLAACMEDRKIANTDVNLESMERVDTAKKQVK